MITTVTLEPKIVYEWECPDCGHVNKTKQVTLRVECDLCGEECLVALLDKPNS